MPPSLSRSSSLIQVEPSRRMSSYDRAREKLKLSSDVQVDGRIAKALDLVQEMEKRWKRLRRQAMRATRTVNWHTDHASQKYGVLTTEVLDFLEPALLQHKAEPEAAVDLVALHKELRRRTQLAEPPLVPALCKLEDVGLAAGPCARRRVGHRNAIRGGGLSGAMSSVLSLCTPALCEWGLSGLQTTTFQPTSRSYISGAGSTTLAFAPLLL